jgi:hypothetical protein
MPLALPEGLPSISRAWLPQTYAAARTALAECSRIDEYASWAQKAEALASYAKHAKDDAFADSGRPHPGAGGAPVRRTARGDRAGQEPPRR